MMQHRPFLVQHAEGRRLERHADRRRTRRLVHTAINIAHTTDGGTHWLGPVTDEEYAGG
jgi:hypothetical protein